MQELKPQLSPQGQMSLLPKVLHAGKCTSHSVMPKDQNQTPQHTSMYQLFKNHAPRCNKQDS
jgi:hypothetical protein